MKYLLILSVLLVGCNSESQKTFEKKIFDETVQQVIDSALNQASTVIDSIDFEQVKKDIKNLQDSRKFHLNDTAMFKGEMVVIMLEHPKGMFSDYGGYAYRVGYIESDPLETRLAYEFELKKITKHGTKI